MMSHLKCAQGLFSVGPDNGFHPGPRKNRLSTFVLFEQQPAIKQEWTGSVVLFLVFTSRTAVFDM